MTTTETPAPRQGLSPMTILIIAVLIGGAFLIGKLYSEVNLLRQGVGTTANNAQAGTTGTTAQAPVLPSDPQEMFPTVDMSLVDDVSPTDHIRGSADASVFLIEYSDTDCPYCKAFHPTMQQIIDEYDGQVAWVYRHYPLEMLHPGAPKEAEATECVNELAGTQAFWTYLDDVVDTNYDIPGLVQLATSQGLNGASVESCINSGKHAAKVNQHLQSGQRAGVTGTPGTLLVANGQARLIPGAYPYSEVKRLVDEALAQQ